MTVNHALGFYRVNSPDIYFLFLLDNIIFSSFEFNGTFINKASAHTCTTNPPLTGVTASGNNGNVPLQTFLITILLQDGPVTELVNGFVMT